MKYFHYVCSNVEGPWSETSSDVYELELPIYLNHNFKKHNGDFNIRNMEQLMSLYSFEAERSYYAIEYTPFINNIIRVASVETHIKDGVLYIQYIFEDNSEFSFDTQNMDSLSEKNLKYFADIAKEAADFVFYLNTPLMNKDLIFEGEYWCNWDEL